MAGFFQSFDVSDIALGKPALDWLPSSASVADALRVLKELELSEISIWDCASEVEYSVGAKNIKVDSQIEARSVALRKRERNLCKCVGKVNIVDIICYLAKDQLENLDVALKEPVSVLLLGAKHYIQHIDAHARLADAFKLFLGGTHYLVVPLDIRRLKALSYYTSGNLKLTKDASTNRKDFCWLTQEDALRFMLANIAVFSPLPMISIEELGIIKTEVMVVSSKAKAIKALPFILDACAYSTAVAVVDDDLSRVGDSHSKELKLIGDISLSTFRHCDEGAALALATLSVEDFLTYTEYTQEHGEPPEALVELVQLELSKKVSNGVQVEIPSSLLYRNKSDVTDSSSASEPLWDESSESSEDESVVAMSRSVPKRSNSSLKRVYSPRNMWPLTCHPWSSLIAVMAQAVAHRTGYVWVTDNDNTLIGIVTYGDIIRVLSGHLTSFE